VKGFFRQGFLKSKRSGWEKGNGLDGRNGINGSYGSNGINGKGESRGSSGKVSSRVKGAVWEEGNGLMGLMGLMGEMGEMG